MDKYQFNSRITHGEICAEQCGSVVGGALWDQSTVVVSSNPCLLGTLLGSTASKSDNVSKEPFSAK